MPQPGRRKHSRSHLCSDPGNLIFNFEALHFIHHGGMRKTQRLIFFEKKNLRGLHASVVNPKSRTGKESQVRHWFNKGQWG